MILLQIILHKQVKPLFNFVLLWAYENHFKEFLNITKCDVIWENVGMKCFCPNNIIPNVR